MTATNIQQTRRTFDFPTLWPKALAASAVIVLASIIALAIGGLNLGIDFEGGTSIEVQTEASLEEVRDALPETLRADARLQEATSQDGQRSVRVRTTLQSTNEDLDVAIPAMEALGETNIRSVGPSWGSAVTGKAIRALIVFFIGIAIYISVRLEWKMAVGALAAVVHDIIISVGAYAIFRFEVTPATLIAFLTIMGYSLYDTIVVYDKVRDITARVGATGRYSYTEMMNLALNQVLARSINTTITSIIPVLSMLIIGSLILGAATLQEFSIALLVGLIVGGYSSLFVASFVVTQLKEREPEYIQIANKVAKKADGDDGATREVDTADLLGSPRRAARPKSSKAATATDEAPPKPTKSKKAASSSGSAAGPPPKPRKTKKKKK